MRPLLHICGIPSFRGWADTIGRIQRQIKEEGEDYDRQIDALKTAYSEHLLTGEKAVKIFSIQSSKMKTLVELLSSYSIEPSVYGETYPFPLGKEELEEASYTTRLVEIRKVEDNLAVVFCTKRNISQRVKLSDEEVSPQLLNEYDEIVAKKERAKQFFDVVFLKPEEGIAEVRIDIEDGMSSEDRNISFENIENIFNALCERELQVPGNALHKPINIFSVIEGLYKSEEGTVTEVYFKTNEGSTKRERMKLGGEDLRKEIYHKAGTERLIEVGGGMDVYRMKLVWKIPVSEDLSFRPSVMLPGRMATLSQSTPSLHEFILTGCGTIRDYESIFRKVFTHIADCD